MSPIISLPRRQKTHVMLCYSLVTLVAWVGFAYMLWPLASALVAELSLAASLKGLSALSVAPASALFQGQSSLIWLPLSAGGGLIVFVAWAEVRLYRHRRLKQAREAAALCHTVLASDMRASLQLATSISETKRGILNMDATGNPLGVEQLPARRRNTTPPGPQTPRRRASDMALAS